MVNQNPPLKYFHFNRKHIFNGICSVSVCFLNSLKEFLLHRFYCLKNSSNEQNYSIYLEFVFLFDILPQAHVHSIKDPAVFGSLFQA